MEMLKCVFHSYFLLMIRRIFCTGGHGAGIAKKPWIRKAFGEVFFETYRELKTALDPNGLLNPGKFLD